MVDSLPAHPSSLPTGLGMNEAELKRNSVLVRLRWGRLDMRVLLCACLRGICAPSRALLSAV